MATRTGDFNYKACASFCKAERGAQHCEYCKVNGVAVATHPLSVSDHGLTCEFLSRARAASLAVLEVRFLQRGVHRTRCCTAAVDQKAVDQKGDHTAHCCTAAVD